MVGASDLREKIEMARAELNQLAELAGIQGAVVLAKSQELDRLLNAYNRFVMDKNERGLVQDEATA